MLYPLQSTAAILVQYWTWQIFMETALTFWPHPSEFYWCDPFTCTRLQCIAQLISQPWAKWKLESDDMIWLTFASLRHLSHLKINVLYQKMLCIFNIFAHVQMIFQSEKLSEHVKRNWWNPGVMVDAKSGRHFSQNMRIDEFTIAWVLLAWSAVAVVSLVSTKLFFRQLQSTNRFSES